MIDTNRKLGLLILTIFLFLNSSIIAQTKRTYTKQHGTTIDNIYIENVKKGGAFITVESFIQEYSTNKPALTATYRFNGIDSDGNLLVRYAYNNKLLNFKIKTTLILKNWDILNFVVDSSRKSPLEVAVKSIYKDAKLEVEYLN